MSMMECKSITTTKPVRAFHTKTSRRSSSESWGSAWPPYKVGQPSVQAAEVGPSGEVQVAHVLARRAGRSGEGVQLVV